MKKALSLVLAAGLIVSSMAFGSSAYESENSNVFYYGDKEIIIEGENLSQSEMQSIADYIAGYDEHQASADDGDVSPCGLACLFGHNIKTSYATEITHNVYTTSPKCVKKVYTVKTCTRSSCDYIEKTLDRSSRISSCHG